MTNKEEILDVLHEIEYKCGIHIKDYVIKDWVEDIGKDTICNFHIRELPRYLFCLWNTCNLVDKEKYARDNDIEEDSSYLFFVDYERYIDKFKPGHCGCEVGIRKHHYLDSQENHDNDNWALYNVEDIILFMRKHKYRAYHCITTCQNYIWDYESGIKCFMEYVNDSLYFFKNRIKDKREQKHISRVIKRNCKKLTQLNVVAYKDSYSNLQYTVVVRRKSDMIDSRLWDRDWKRIDKLADKYFLHVYISCCECFLMEPDDEPLTDKEIEEDKEMQERFDYTYKKFMENSSNDFGDLIYMKNNSSEFDD